MSQHFCSVDWPHSELLLSGNKLDRCIFHYKALYIVVQDFNQAFGKLFIPTLKLMFLFVFVIGVFVGIRLRTQFDLISITVLCLAAILAFTFMVPVAFIMSSLFNMSDKYKRNLMTIVQHFPKTVERDRKTKYFAYQLKSCPWIRCTVGGLYYMESKAKLTMIDRSVNGVVFLLVKVKT